MTVSIPALVAAAATSFADAEAVVDGDRRVTFAQLLDQCLDVSAASYAAGLRPGDRVGVWAPNSLEWIVTALGLSCAGLVLVPMNTRLRGPEASYLIEKADIKALFTVNGFLGTDYLSMLRNAGHDDSGLRSVILEGPAPSGAMSLQAFLQTGASVSRADTIDALHAVSGADLGDIIFTSGTTGNPKGVLSRHEQNSTLYKIWCENTGLRRGDRYLMANPFSHSFGLKAGIFVCLMQGATMYPERVFDAEAFMRRINDERITLAPAPPTIYLSILDHPRRGDYDLSSLRIAVPGGSVNTVTMVNRVIDELKCEGVYTGYGLTECGIVTMTRPGSDAETIVTTAGWPVSGVEVQIVDDDNQVLSTGNVGEICIRGFTVTAGYLDQPEETAKAFAADGWFRTGDLGSLDDLGRLRITDRKKDMYIVGGLNAYPAEIENALARHPDIGQVAVIGVPDERLGEVGMAFIVPRPGRTPIASEIIAWSRDQISNYKVPRFVEVVDALPMTASGKAQKPELRAMAAEILAPQSS